MEDLKPTDVHDALKSAQFESMDAPIETQSRTKILNTRCTQSERDEVKRICASHGTTPSAFLHKCITGLIKDYGG